MFSFINPPFQSTDYFRNTPYGHHQPMDPRTRHGRYTSPLSNDYDDDDDCMGYPYAANRCRVDTRGFDIPHRRDVKGSQCHGTTRGKKPVQKPQMKSQQQSQPQVKPHQPQPTSIRQTPVRRVRDPPLIEDIDASNRVPTCARCNQPCVCTLSTATTTTTPSIHIASSDDTYVITVSTPPTDRHVSDDSETVATSPIHVAVDTTTHTVTITRISTPYHDTTPICIRVGDDVVADDVVVRTVPSTVSCRGHGDQDVCRCRVVEVCVGRRRRGDGAQQTVSTSTSTTPTATPAPTPAPTPAQSPSKTPSKTSSPTSSPKSKRWNRFGRRIIPIS